MKPIMTTVAALKELATGLSADAIEASSALYMYAGQSWDVIVARGDDLASQRVYVMRQERQKALLVPDHLISTSRSVLSRMASFAERVRSPGSLSLPRGWHQYKHKNFVAFFAAPSQDINASRWIAEVLSGDPANVVFWRITTSSQRDRLEQFEEVRPSLPPNKDSDWQQAISSAGERFSQLSETPPSDVEISLPPLQPSATQGWSYSQWLQAVSGDQRSFIEAKTDKSIRLRGPAGSGKTLALTLKAIREVVCARDRGEQLRVLMVTHSWSLAAEISDSLDSMGLGVVDEIDVFPLLEIAKNVSPQYVQDSSGFNLIGTDSFSGKQAQLDEILEVLEEFIEGDWITYRKGVSDSFRDRFDSPDSDERFALAWDLLVEFGSVIGAAAIFPGVGAENRYSQLSRASWMLPIGSREDSRVVFVLYEKYMKSLEGRSLLTSDQVLADLLSHLETYTWNRSRRQQGYDLIFVDEFHLFSPLERQVLHYMSRDVSVYPRVFMAVDPRQSPSAAFIGVAADETRSSSFAADVDSEGEFASFELNSVHRFTPEILSLVKHVHHEFPTLDLGHDWAIDFALVESEKPGGPMPSLISAETQSGEEDDIAKAVHELYPRGRLALAIVDMRLWRRFSALASRLGASSKFHVTTITGRTDIDGLGYRHRGLVVGPAEYLAGLQFDAVLIAGVPSMRAGNMPASNRTQLLSLLYLALSRAQNEVRIFVNEDDGGITEVLARAIDNELLVRVQGSLV